MLNGMFWILRSGAQWMELPEAYGPWQSVYVRFDDGTLKTVSPALSKDADMEKDSTCIKVHESANGGKNRGQVGRTRGGLNTKTYAVIDGLGNLMEFLLSAGNDKDCVHAVELLEEFELSGSNVLADRAYDARSIREYISEHRARYVISPQSNVSDPWTVDWHLCKARHLIECFFQKIKWFRRLLPGMMSWTPPF